MSEQKIRNPDWVTCDYTINSLVVNDAIGFMFTMEIVEKKNENICYWESPNFKGKAKDMQVCQDDANKLEEVFFLESLKKDQEEK